MLKYWKIRLTVLVVCVALAAVSCTGVSDEAAGPIDAQPAAVQDDLAEPEADEPPTADEPEAADESDETDAMEDGLANGEPAAPVEPEASGVDIANFQAFPLPDYVQAVVGEDYTSYLIEVEPGINMHVLEVGSGYPVYLQHGAPTSGLLYRKVVEQLPPDQFRTIMPTMVGLGFSSKVPAEQHTLDNHTRWMNEALTQLGLENLIYVGHDWGGPVGMGALARSPELMEGAVLLNTSFGAPEESVELNPALAAMLAPIPAEQEAAVVGLIFDQLSGVQSDPASMSPEVVDLYRRPVRESDNPIGPLAILRMSATGPDHPTSEPLRMIDSYIAQIDVPAEIVWADNDPLAGAFLPRITERFPDAPITRTEAGHFLQEELNGPEEIAAAIERVFQQIQSQ